ncbi:MAG: AarF/ABC1/UbiB kinase family protein [Sphingobacteriia bacterium]|nr:AarF/ABC1/UbiB kinase family protein [Sphingobacteriia bacterium]
MNITRIYAGYLQLLRAREISGILLKHLWQEYLDRSPRLRRLLKSKKKRQIPIKNTPTRLRETIEDLGPTYIKFGQILADRPDLVTERFRNELKKLQSKAIPLDDENAIQLIEKELGRPVEEVFKAFDKQAVASASIGQTYRAILQTGEEVIIKIQRPHIENKIKLDLYLLSHLAKRAIRNYPELAVIDVVGLIDEFGVNILKELNYFNEVNNINRFQDLFKDDPRVHIPKVYTEFTTRRLIVMEFIHGIAPDKIDHLKEAGLDPSIIAKNGADIILKMILRHGFFHADPHPGNLFVMPGNVIAFIDFGMAGVLRPRHMTFLADFSLGFSQRNSKSIARSLVKLCDIKFFDQMEEMEFEIDDLLKGYSSIPFDKLDFSQIMQECINIIVRYELKIPSNIFLLVKALATLQKFATQLQPDLSLGPIIIPYAKNLVLQKYSPKKFASDIYDTLGEYVSLIKEFPRDVREILYHLKQGKITHEITTPKGDSIYKTLKRFTSRISLVILLSGVLISSATLMIYRPDSFFGTVSFTLASIITLYLIIKLLFSSKR